MPIGIVSDEQFNSELTNSGSVNDNKSSPNELKRARIEELPVPGRSEGDVNVPDEVRKVIADTALSEGRSAALSFARSLGISDSSTSAYSNGSTSTASYDKKNDSLHSFLQSRKAKIARKATKVLNTALDEITETKLGSLKTIEVAQVAKMMSSIVKDMEPEVEKSNETNVNVAAQIVMYAPPIISESKFEVIHVNEG